MLFEGCYSADSLPHAKVTGSLSNYVNTGRNEKWQVSSAHEMPAVEFILVPMLGAPQLAPNSPTPEGDSAKVPIRSPTCVNA